MSAPVDVLAVLDGFEAGAFFGSEQFRIREARTAVTELIEAAQAALDEDDGGRSAPRLRAALARIGGAE